jgi:hypothetical protein
MMLHHSPRVSKAVLIGALIEAPLAFMLVFSIQFLHFVICLWVSQIVGSIGMAPFAILEPDLAPRLFQAVYWTGVFLLQLGFLTLLIFTILGKSSD